MAMTDNNEALAAENRVKTAGAERSAAVTRTPELWYYIQTPLQLKSGVGNSFFGYAYKIAQKLGAQMRVIAPDGELYQEARRIYKDYDVSFARMDDPESMAALGASPPVVLCGGLERNQMRVWMQLKNALWPRQSVEVPIFADRPDDSNGPAAHRITFDMLDKARVDKGLDNNDYPEPRLLVELASPDQGSLLRAIKAIDQVVARHPACSIMVSTSPRTANAPPVSLTAFFKNMQGVIDDARAEGKHVAYSQYNFGESVIHDAPCLPEKEAVVAARGEVRARVKNPYVTMLAHADAVVILGDSWSMASEAAMTGKPVYYEAYENRDEFHYNAHQRLGAEETQRYRPLSELGDFDVAATPTYTPCDATEYFVDDFLRGYQKSIQELIAANQKIER